MRHLPPLSALRAFEAAARHLSFKRAAAELAVTPTAISHQLRQLESWLDTSLFERRVREVVLTPAGQALYPAVREGFDALARGVEALRQRPERVVVTLSATVAFTAKWLVPRVAAFRAACPGIDLSLHASDDVAELGTGTAEFAIRYSRSPPPELRSQRLLHDRFAPVCSPQLGVRDPGDLARHPLLHFSWRRLQEDTPTWRRWFAAAGLSYDPAAGELFFSDETHAIQAALAGDGIALASLVLVADELANGSLVQPFETAFDGFTYFLVNVEPAGNAESIDTVRRWLLNEAETFTARGAATPK